MRDSRLGQVGALVDDARCMLAERVGGDGMNESRGKCPVCLRQVWRTPHSNIYNHMDNVGERCLGSGEPFTIAYVNSDYQEAVA